MLLSTNILFLKITYFIWFLSLRFLFSLLHYRRHVCRNGLRLTGCRAVPDGQDVKRNPISCYGPLVCLMKKQKEGTHTAMHVDR